MLAPRSLVAALPLLLLGVACAGAEKKPVEPLPFHVAVIPFYLEQREGALDAEADGVTDFRLDLEADAVSRAFQEVLDGNYFTRSTLLAGSSTGDVAGSDDAWVQAAAAAGADLLLEAQLVYSPLVRTDTNEKFWLNFPLFLLGGPMVWFVDDRSYHIDTRLSINVYDVPPMLNPVVEARADLNNRDSLLMSLDLTHTEADFDFIDRADGVGDYALSILIPAGFVATDNTEVLAGLQQDIVASLAEQLTARIEDRRQDLIQPQRLVHFWTEDFGIKTSADGRRFVAGDVVLRTDEVPRMDAYVVEMPGERARQVRFDEGAVEKRAGRSYRRYAVSQEIPAQVADGEVRVRIFDASANERTFTVPVRGVEALATPVEAVYRPGSAQLSDA